MENGPLSLYSITAADLAAALDYTSRQPLPDATHVFPWLHGIHPQNHIQQAFFTTRHRALRKTPHCLRGVTVVKADGDMSVSRLKGAISSHEFMQSGSSPEFIDVDPREGFSVRNFHIQAAKHATTSDIIVYGEDVDNVTKLGWDIAEAQRRWHDSHEAAEESFPEYNTFICTSPFSEFEDNFYDIVAIDSSGTNTGNVIDFFLQERREMYAMTKASEISHNVWVGPTPYPGSMDEEQFDILIECNDLGHLNPAALQAVAESKKPRTERPHFNFPSSGSILPPTWSHAEADAILETCKWIFHLAHGTYPAPVERSAFDDDDDDDDDDVSDADADADADPDAVDDDGRNGDTEMAGVDENQPKSKLGPQKILVHCADGYTESTMLAIAYFSYSTGCPVPKAWVDLHRDKKRNFFAYPADVALLSAISARLLHESPVCSSLSLRDITSLVKAEPPWFAGLDGSLPSRILDYMYLGNLGHASNPDLLRALGIGQVLSVGETAMWRDGEHERWGGENICSIDGVQDNGIDPLTDEFERCLEFIDRGRRSGTATLVHCRVGVSRSATICIAEVMRALDLSFPRAYCLVRARRLNVIIQPHLRFTYELLKWEEILQVRKHGVESCRRELEWGEVTREVAQMNQPYANR
ncbi:related to protein tyrosine phosphatase PPS1 [Cephalotrichum gorgonifer]|uniref:Related to protein tyrosine phosphatase PPS1 n=1 Tax=Cephalotrichum gorgonifer TaxID=2041049 RepID=A0AAE8SYE0_9PEZI|nr:related to protein tyrosine phosphatase PPS1 [Cephalotrichum gorgonifer]